MSNKASIPDEVLMNKIYVINDIKVMLDSDLAELYLVGTKRLNEQVKRNADRFPEDFMFQLSREQWENLESQNATSSWGGRRTLPKIAALSCKCGASLAVGCGNNNLGINSERIRLGFQNVCAHWWASPQPAFQMLGR